MKVIFKRDVLAEHILRRNLSTNSFARKADLTGGHLSQLLAGKRQPAANTREKLLKATETERSSGLEFDDLFEIVTDKS